MKTVKEIMTPNVRCVGPNDSLADAARLMGELDVGALPICDNDRLAGMITDRDIAVRGVGQGLDPAATSVRDTMSRGIVYVYDDQDVGEAARIFEQNKIRRLAVLNRNKRLVGIISIGDLAVNGGAQLGGEALSDISEPSHAHRR